MFCKVEARLSFQNRNEMELTEGKQALFRPK